MNKKILLSLAGALMLTVGVVGCDDNGNGGKGGSRGAGSGGTSGMGGMGGTGGMGGQGVGTWPDNCVKSTPATDSDFLNACPPATTDSKVLDPKYPDKTPNGVLPAL